jgi:Na+-translocating ferredoxin:NAD+ oxidoreductase subunit G
MREIIKITVALTISCLLAGLVMGSVFVLTAKAKKHNEHLSTQRTMLGLLGYGKTKSVPSDLNLNNVYRYIITQNDSKYLGYMLPVKKENSKKYELLVLDLKGNFADRHSLDISPEDISDPKSRKTALQSVLSPSADITYADTIIIATRNDRRIAYILPGEFPGFKTIIKAMLALDTDFKILGLEIIEHEEDPGLGGEIEQEYFKNQFKLKPFEKIKKLKVIKKPLPETYRKYLERKKWEKGDFSKEDIAAIQKNYQDKDIYALTGATISSVSVTNGIRNMTTKFAYRIKILDKIIASKNIHVPF